MKIFVSAIFLLVISLGSQSQHSKWSPFLGLGVSGNSEMFYIGPSIMAGVQKPMGKKQKWVWVPEIQYFSKKITDEISRTETENFSFKSFSIRSNFNFFFGKTSNRGFFVGGGIGFQHASDDSELIKETGQVKETIPGEYVYEYSRLMPTFNFGQSFLLKKGRTLQILVSAIGPYHEDHGNWSCTEIISVLSLNARFGF